VIATLVESVTAAPCERRHELVMHDDQVIE
jgi:hypothetical protein